MRQIDKDKISKLYSEQYDDTPLDTHQKDYKIYKTSGDFESKLVISDDETRSKYIFLDFGSFQTIGSGTVMVHPPLLFKIMDNHQQNAFIVSKTDPIYKNIMQKIDAYQKQNGINTTLQDI